MTPAQLGVLIAEHNELNDPEQAEQRKRRNRKYDDPSAMFGLAGMKIGG